MTCSPSGRVLPPTATRAARAKYSKVQPARAGKEAAAALEEAQGRLGGLGDADADADPDLAHWPHGLAQPERAVTAKIQPVLAAMDVHGHAQLARPAGQVGERLAAAPP